MNFSDIKFCNSSDTQDDFLKLREIHRETMKKSIVESLGGWDDEFQKNRLQKHFADAYKTLQFISYNNDIIGTINYHKKTFDDGEFNFIEQFYLLPKYQGNGLGTHILNLKTDESEIRLTVLNKDVLTQQFYIKNGFFEYKEDQYQKFMKKPSLEHNCLKTNKIKP